MYSATKLFQSEVMLVFGVGFIFYELVDSMSKKKVSMTDLEINK